MPAKQPGPKQESFGILRYTLGRTDLSTIRILLKENRDVIFRHPVLISVNLLLSIVLIPLKWYEKTRYKKPIAETELAKNPLIILGHYRSGTTHLFNLIAIDNSYAYISSVKAAVPGIYLTLGNLIQRFFSLLTSGRRPCDNMTVAADSAQEDEYAMTHQSPHSFLHVLSFPKKFKKYIHKYTLFETISPNELADWQSTYTYMLRKLSFSSNNRQLLIKNPEHTGRLQVITGMFPQAKFIHIVRNPYEVYISSIYLYKSLFPYTALQPISDSQIRELVITRYQLMMQSYIDNYELIPKENLVEIRFEDIEQDPNGCIRDLCKSLGIPISQQYIADLQRYTASINGYQKNSYNISQDDIDLVNREWGFAFEYWNYAMK